MTSGKGARAWDPSIAADLRHQNIRRGRIERCLSCSDGAVAADAPSEQDRHEGAGLREPDPPVDGLGRSVEVVDIQGDHRRQPPPGELDDRCHPPAPVPSVAQSWRYPYALDLAGLRRDRTDLG